jgi:hypothetical protein
MKDAGNPVTAAAMSVMTTFRVVVARCSGCYVCTECTRSTKVRIFIVVMAVVSWTCMI